MFRHCGRGYRRRQEAKRKWFSERLCERSRTCSNSNNALKNLQPNAEALRTLGYGLHSPTLQRENLLFGSGVLQHIQKWIVSIENSVTNLLKPTGRTCLVICNFWGTGGRLSQLIPHSTSDFASIVSSTFRGSSSTLKHQIHSNYHPLFHNITAESTLSWYQPPQFRTNGTKEKKKSAFQHCAWC